MVAVILFCSAWLLMWPRRGAFGATELTDLADSVSRIEQHLRMGHHHWCPDSAPLSQPALRECLDYAWRDGLPIVPSLAALTEAVSSALELSLGCRALCLLLWGRVGIAIAAAALACWFLVAPTDIFVFKTEQVTAAFVAAAVSLTAHVMLQKVLPRPWLLCGGHLSAQMPLWLKAHIDCQKVTGLSVDSDLRALSEREFKFGISLLQEKRNLIASWSQVQLAAGRLKLQRIQDFLPLIELFGVGLPLTILIALPTKAFLATVVA